MTTDSTVLVIAGEDQSRNTYRRLYEGEGMTVHVAADVTEPGVEALRETVGLVVLESRVHGRETMSFCRQSTDRLGPPIILISPSADLSDQVLALELGADEVLLKPADPKLLMAKSRALMRRRQAGSQWSAGSGGWAVDSLRGEVHTPDGRRFRVPPVQARLMHVFIRNPGRMVTTEDLRLLMDPDHGADPFILRTAVSRLRRLLSRHAGMDPIRTVRGSGYVFEE